MKKRRKGRNEIGCGENCPKCGRQMKRYRHANNFKPREGHAYYSWWDICYRCNRQQNYEAAKVIDGKINEPDDSGTAPKSFSRGFYKSWEWKKLRYEILKERGARCECCGATPEHGARIVVDHIKPVRRFWQLRLEKSNCQVLCNDCNMGKSGDDTTDWNGSNIVPFPNVEGL
jgi:HNH endonuclease